MVFVLVLRAAAGSYTSGLYASEAQEIATGVRYQHVEKRSKMREFMVTCVSEM